MVRFLISTAFLLAANAIGLLVANALLEDMDMTAGAFVLAVLIFTGVVILVRPFIMKMAVRYFEALMGGSALVATLVGLIVTKIFVDGFHITGLGTWALATVIVWVIAMLAGVLLPALLLKRTVQEGAQRRANS
ncbi:MAG: hypothetical protein WAS51_13840 [Ilumatobacteraceae bacterium]|nr:MAG: phage holin family protein [Actinomycetota bacterium]